jgi:hypothetical protein
VSQAVSRPTSFSAVSAWSIRSFLLRFVSSRATQRFRAQSARG